MLRNREIQIYLFALSLIGIIASLLGAILFTYQVALYLLITSLLLIITSILFTSWRYKEIEKLSSYLRRISNGEVSLDIRDNNEGELSILKNDIYKVTSKLSEHQSLLQQEKGKLTNAISDISHQLKTPLTSMMVMADLLSDSNLGADKRVEFTQNICVQLERMEWLVSSLLKLSKIDAGTVQFKNERVVVKQLIHKAAETVLIPMDIKQQTLIVKEHDQVTFKGDFNWTLEAIINILKNSVEHTSVGGEISITYSENALYTEITIADNGKGINKKDLPHIFKRFYKGKNAGDESVGIGLAMAYSIITSQIGDIQVSSEKGKGTTFQIKFYKQVI